MNNNTNKMDYIKPKDVVVPIEEFDIKGTGQTSDNFQKFICELFAKNGVINDLRAYLRRHIVNVLKNAETGDLPACQKYFTQRLERPLQALNILIVEYLLTMEFNYTLSVFISEIPLASMVFEFTKALLNLDTEAEMSSLQFEDMDVWSILNYIGVKCSSEHALKIVEMYKIEKQPLLWCILKCVSMYQKEEEHICNGSSSTQSSDTLGDRPQEAHKYISQCCNHYRYCKACQNRVASLKEKYRKRKALMEEILQQMKTTYETQVEIVKKEERNKVKKLIASHALQLQKYRVEVEQSFKAREKELRKAIQQKKRFLWGLARSLRDQHMHLATAMTDVRRQTDRLNHQESSIKTQLEETEQTLRKRGEHMKTQLSEELIMMEGHLERIKRERDRINEERKEIENTKNNDTRVEKILVPQYDYIKNELSILRKNIEATTLKPKDDLTDIGIKCFMNKENIGTKKEKLETIRLINDLKKFNNSHFGQSNIDDINNMISERPPTDPSVRDSGSIGEGEMVDEVILDMDNVYTNDRHLRVGDIQDGDPGDTRGRGTDGDTRGRGTDGDTRGRGTDGDTRGRGTDGDTRGRGTDGDTFRRHNNGLKEFTNQQRESIQALLYKKDKLQQLLSERPRPGTAPPGAPHCRGHGKITQRSYQQSVPEAVEVREERPKSCLREFGEKLQSKLVKQNSPQANDNSSDAMLREARRRLRKLDIEAEAAEKSYQDFRKRRNRLEGERESMGHVSDNLIEKIYNLQVKHKPIENYENKSTKRNLPLSYHKESSEAIKDDFDKYFKEYTAKLDFRQSRLANKNSVMKNVKPIPAPLSNKKEVNYLETPLMEFRKLYQGQRTIQNRKLVKDDQTEKDNSGLIIKSEKVPNFINNNRVNKILHDNINNSPKPKSTLLTNEFDTDTSINSNIDIKNNLNNYETTQEIDNNKSNLLMVEVENGRDNVVVPKENIGVLIVVESSVDTVINRRDVSDDGRTTSTPMTLLVSPVNKGGSEEVDSPVERSRSASSSVQDCGLKTILQPDNDKVSSVDLQSEFSKECEMYQRSGRESI